MSFKKGHSQLNTGKTHFKKGRHYSLATEFKKGRKPTKEWREIMKKKMKGNKNSVGRISPRKGVKLSDSTKEKIRIAAKKRVGEMASNWKGDRAITPINKRIRVSLEYKLWRKSVFERDKYTCIWCGAGGNINADHIKPFAYFPELRFAIDNGRTLCVPCHKSTETYGYKARKIL